MSVTKRIRIGGASGFWGEAPHATRQLLEAGPLDFLVYDYLAEITMALLARMRAKDANAGFVPDFLSAAMAPNLEAIASRNVRVISNAGGMNPAACAAKLRALVAERGLDLKVAAVLGDDLAARAGEFALAGMTDMLDGSGFPTPEKIASANAYLGAFPIAAALDAGADIVVTGRCVDSAPSLAACIHSFGWKPEDQDRLAAGSLAGHLLECGPQATGGNFTDWEEVAGIADIGYPIAEIEADGRFLLTKAANTGGLVSPATVGEQLLYEIGDPQGYVLPDVVCDFSGVTLRQAGTDRVEVAGARGLGAPEKLKLCVTWHDGFRGGHLFGFYGIDAVRKATAFADAVLERAHRAAAEAGIGKFKETSVEVLGSERQFGAFGRGESREVNVKIAVRHARPEGVELFIRSAFGLGLSAPPGLSGFAGARPKPSPVLALFSGLIDRNEVAIEIDEGNSRIAFEPVPVRQPASVPERPPAPEIPADANTGIPVPVIRLAWARSGDKGNSANVGVLARKPEYLPYLWAALDERFVAETFAHFLEGGVERYLLPGLNAINFLLTDALGGGGVSSLRADPQGKGYAQLLLAREISVPEKLLAEE